MENNQLPRQILTRRKKKSEEHDEVVEPTNIHMYSRQKDWGSVIEYKPLFSPDSKYLLVVSGNTVKVLSTESGSLVEVHLHHDNKVIGVQPADEDGQYVSCDESGCLCFWKIRSKEGAIKYNINFKKKVKNGKVKVFQYNRRYEEVYILIEKKENKETALMTYQAPYGTTPPEVFRSKDQVAVKSNLMDISGCWNYLAYVSHDCKALFLRSRTPLESGRMQVMHYVKKNPLTCLAFHPTHQVLATGDVSGQVTIWYEITRTIPKRMVMHWHHSLVADLAFSVSGSSLFTGGGECVLVIWDLTKEDRSFVPHVGMPITYVTADTTNSFVALSQVDNSITIIKIGSYRVERVIQGFAVNVGTCTPMSAGIQYDSRTRTVVMNGKTGHVQFYDIHNSKLLYHLDITMCNYHSQDRKQKIHNTEVQFVAVSPNGLRLATTEYRDDGTTSLELRIKFWNYTPDSQKWILNTSIDMPHQKAMTGIIFQPTSDDTSLCVTGSEDGKFKIWEETDNSDIYGTKGIWTCCSLGFYRDLPVASINFSPDASLLAVSFESVLTLWEPASCQLMGTLSQPYLNEKILQVEFGRGEGCRSLVVCRSKKWLCVWDLLTCSLSWRVSIHSAYLAADPLSPFMTIFSEDCTLYVFDPRRSKFLSMQEKACNDPPLAAAFIPRIKKADDCTFWNTHSTLLYVSKNQTLHTVEVSRDIKSANERIDGEVLQLLQESEGSLPPCTPFAALVAATKTSHVTEEKKTQKGKSSFGLQFEKSTEFIQKVLNETRVYRLDSFAKLSVEFSNLVIPDPQTSSEQEHEEDFGKMIMDKVGHESPEKKILSPKKRFKKDIKKVTQTDFSSLMNMLSL